MACSFDPNTYGPVVAELLREERMPPLGPGSPNAAARPLLEAAAAERLFAHAGGAADRAMGQACLAGLWLYHDFLDESHTISQSIATATGSYWHGLMHRREPDFSNSSYWFRRVGQHPAFEPLAEMTREIGSAAGRLKKAAWLASVRKWEPFRFIDLCEACYAVEDEDQLVCRQVSLAEWRLLFDYSYRQAVVGKG